MKIGNFRPMFEAKMKKLWFLIQNWNFDRSLELKFIFVLNKISNYHIKYLHRSPQIPTYLPDFVRTFNSTCTYITYRMTCMCMGRTQGLMWRTQGLMKRVGFDGSQRVESINDLKLQRRKTVRWMMDDVTNQINQWNSVTEMY